MTPRPDATAEFERAVSLMATLRSPDGCAWDREQSHSSLRKHVIEEAYEVAEAIDGGDLHALRDELGDLFLQVLFHSRIAEESSAFDIADVLSSINQKLLRRHPHVFADESASTPGEVMVHWEAAKKLEREGRSAASDRTAGPSALDGVPVALPALIRAEKLQKRAAGVGFDWPDIDGVLDKVIEEVEELRSEMHGDEREKARVEGELGDIIFSIVNLARHLEVDAEEALTQTNDRFIRRFQHMEGSAADSGEGLPGSLKRWEELWENAKSATR